jgi:hypothetical protein
MEKFETMYGFSQKMDLKADILKDALLQFVKIVRLIAIFGYTQVFT